MNKKTWIVLADGAKALIFCQKGQGQSIEQIAKLESGDIKIQNHDPEAVMPGHAHSNKDHSRSFADGGDFQSHAKEQFAHDLAHWIVKKDNEHAFDHLIISAAPKTLGELRAVLHDNHSVKNKIVKELHKDLTTVPDQEIGEELQKILHNAA